MSTAKIKNIVLVVLLFLNVFFLAVAARDIYENNAARRRTIENFGVIMQNGGIELSDGAMPELTAPKPQKTSRDPYAEATIARAALGDCEPTDSGGTPSQYIGERGTATFNARDEFEIKYTGDYAVAENEAEMLSVAKKLLRRMKIETAEPEISDNGGDITVFAAVCRYRKTPTFNCVITFTFDDGRLIGIAGRRPSGVSEAAGGAERDLPTSMLGFLQFVLDSGAEVTKITGITAGYRLNVGAFGTGELMPCWRLDTDAGAFYIDALTGAVEAAA
ncbi:MAG: hypothetical protein LBN00_03315 [Oscillospiraceae bacterium]|jgi:hypothetical protein|nr:hypothetical protein [Oscillospiraceae bacterium]